MLFNKIHLVVTADALAPAVFYRLPESGEYPAGTPPWGVVP